MIAPVVDAAWTAAHRGELVLADVRWYLDGRPGRAEYDRGHMPGAVFVELDDWLAAPASPAEGRHPLPDPEVFARGMARARDRRRRHRRGLRRPGRRGRGAARVDAARDRPRGGAARRRHRAPGRARWRPSRPARAPAAFSARPWPAERARERRRRRRSRQRRHRRPPARALPRRGPDPVDPRPGHIPGARSLPAREHLGEDGRLLDARRAPRAASRRPASTAPSRSSPTAARASPPATTSSCSSTPGSAPAACTPARGRSGAATPTRPAETGEDA